MPFKIYGLRYDSEITWNGLKMAEVAYQIPRHEAGQESIERAHIDRNPRPLWRSWGLLLAGAVLAAVIGTWLVWFSLSVQRKFNEEDIREACHRVMPDTADRCYDTVVIQRGGVRR